MGNGRNAWDCSRIESLITDYITGFSLSHMTVAPQDDPEWVACMWMNENSTRWIWGGVYPDEIGENGVIDVREGRKYDDDIPPDYVVVDTERLRAIGAAAVTRDDSEPTAVPGGLADIFVHTPTTRFTIGTNGLDWATEIGTRLAEND
ncbi:hypothetical protein DW322_05095 [Rhodococcus rhodnii]|uniref:Uncharacterized protein n=2 Tax=Rhodococcus rhodnii TaxID=38312 RepID=R7WHF7_9NOCA|nr:hypothetical protein [Rhodococcus rhodnii]EOM74553.1 hypothetical protein Rrhod_4142 [Rhodococcus rhodnii LMG 5362]TXG89707.1 hypothetical protein DW322_05095 [Rhodococcus rhodnii]